MGTNGAISVLVKEEERVGSGKRREGEFSSRQRRSGSPR